MKTQYKHIHFTNPSNCEDEWNCFNNKNGSFLGFVDYYKVWRKYIIQFSSRAVLDENCLFDIAVFLRQLNEQKKKVRPDKTRSGKIY